MLGSWSNKSNEDRLEQDLLLQTGFLTQIFQEGPPDTREEGARGCSGRFPPQVGAGPVLATAGLRPVKGVIWESQFWLEGGGMTVLGPAEALCISPTSSAFLRAVPAAAGLAPRAPRQGRGARRPRSRGPPGGDGAGTCGRSRDTRNKGGGRGRSCLIPLNN